MRFEVGDRVVGCGIQSDVDITGFIGTIVENHASRTYDWAVEFDEAGIRLPCVGSPDNTATFHECMGAAKDHHGWFCDDENIEPYVETWGGEVSDLVSLL